jgi:hypothetical protein
MSLCGQECQPILNVEHTLHVLEEALGKYFFVRDGLSMEQTVQAARSAKRQGLRLDGLGFESRRGAGNLYPLQNVPTGSATSPQHPIQYVSGGFPGVKRAQRELNHSSRSSAGVKNEWSHTSSPVCAFMACICMNCGAC